MALVESQKTAISYQKPVSVKAIYVSAGQQVKKGNLLLEVDRPDLNFDYDKLLNQKKRAEARITNLNSNYKSKTELLALESKGKIQRLDADIAQLESELLLNQSFQADLQSIGNSPNKTGVIYPDSIKLASYRNEINNLRAHYDSEKRRLKIALSEDIELVNLEIGLIENEQRILEAERTQLKKYAPFDGTIGNVNAQIDEIIPSFQTIVSLYEKRPSTIKAYLPSNTSIKIVPGEEVEVESSNREYSVSGKVIEVGARIVSYRDPADPPSVPEHLGREVFISLPIDNNFLYGEQVFVYPRKK